MAGRRVAGSPGPTQGLGPEICDLARALMKEDAGTGPAAALLTALEENEAEVVPGVEGNLTEVRGPGQRAEQEGPGQDLVSVPIVGAAKGPVTEEPAVDLGTGSAAKAEIRRKERRRKVRTRRHTAPNEGNLEASKLD